ncbi:MAG: NAD(P)H-flavin reductase [Legionellales bacterium RIFCSPHIGHO2_12_FULL_35_11]|nr:MAG: NAD(P)H-flavin reductase [Legionellales bacterium RIFCSPHIGHO2_12_FULL_35_11]
MIKNEIYAQVEYVSPLTDTVLQYILKPEKYISYLAGQYLRLKLGKEYYSYSIANAPLGSQRYELHIRHSRENINNQKLLDEMKHSGGIFLDIPYGNCVLARLSLDKPIIFVAAGSGFAPIKAMLEQLFADGHNRPLKLFWGVRSQSDLYMKDKLLNWQESMNQFSYTTCLSESSEISLTSMVIKQKEFDLRNSQIVMSGPFDLIYKIRDFLVCDGAKKDNIFADAFSFEKE